jgi:hypothetical protein
VLGLVCALATAGGLLAWGEYDGGPRLVDPPRTTAGADTSETVALDGEWARYFELHTNGGTVRVVGTRVLGATPGTRVRVVSLPFSTGAPAVDGPHRAGEVGRHPAANGTTIGRRAHGFAAVLSATEPGFHAVRAVEVRYRADRHRTRRIVVRMNACVEVVARPGRGSAASACRVAISDDVGNG